MSDLEMVQVSDVTYHYSCRRALSCVPVFPLSLVHVSLELPSLGVSFPPSLEVSRFPLQLAATQHTFQLAVVFMEHQGLLVLTTTERLSSQCSKSNKHISEVAWSLVKCLIDVVWTSLIHRREASVNGLWAVMWCGHDSLYQIPLISQTQLTVHDCS